MARHPFSDDSLALGDPGRANAAVRSVSGSQVTIYTNAPGTILADIQTMAGVPIAGSVLTVAGLRLPAFLGPDGVSTLYAKPAGASATTAIYAALDAGAAITTYEQIPDAAENVIYVTPRGSDSNNGRTLKGAKLTLAAGLAALGGTPGKVVAGVGSFTITSGLDFAAGQVIDGMGPGLTEIVCNGDPSTGWFRAAGALAAKSSPTSLLTVNTVLNVQTLTMASTAALAAGDVILVGDDAVPDSAYSTRYAGELQRVKSVDSGTVVTVFGAVRQVYTTANAAGVHKLTMLGGVGLSNVKLRNSAPGTRTAPCIVLYACERPVVDNVEITGFDGPGVSLNYCLDAAVDVNCHDLTDDPANSRFGYGVVCGGASEGHRITGTFSNVRHSVDFGGSTGHRGHPSRVVVNGAVASNCASAAYKTHAGASDITFSDCIASNTRGDGFEIDSINTRVIDCHVSFGGGGGVRFGALARSVTVQGGSYRHNVSPGMRFEAACDGVTIMGVEIEPAHSTGCAGIYVSAAALSLTIIHNRIFNTKGTWPGIYISDGVASTGHIIAFNVIGTKPTGSDPGTTPGSMASAVRLGTLVTGTYVTDNRSYNATGTAFSDLNGTNVMRRNVADTAALPAVTGSRGGNAALASLLTTLATAGYITDSSTA